MKIVSQELKEIEEKVYNRERLSKNDGLTLYSSTDILSLGYLANIVRERKNGNLAYFIRNRHINYSNICVNRCKFCAFSKSIGDEGAYTMTLDEILEKAREAKGTGITEFHIVGGLHPELPFDFYIEMLEALKKEFPAVHIQAFTAVEIKYLSTVSGLSIKDTLLELKKAGLGSLPGGGAEIFSERVRRELCEEKTSGEEWLEVMEEAHNIGMKSNATMLYGHLEKPEEKIEHLIRLRELQDRTGGFMSFIPLAFHPENTQLKSFNFTTGIDDLKEIAIARLMLDNFPHIKAFWIMIGLKLAQISLSFGADDIDGTVVEEKITHSAGAQTGQFVSREELVSLIKKAGREPVERDTLYNRVSLPAS
ncbi:MAG: aminofutalosine synthase MqnE [Candidatus Schekmanbacteria bacterium]|nr:MAG: aminofutalosine synthase MqnE [Candidatus Schekmanbacteria bacterium]